MEEAGVRTDSAAGRRGRAAAGILLLVLAILAAQFFRLQVLGASRFEVQSERNRVRQIPIPPARGAIYDRRGRLLAENVPGYSVSLLPTGLDSARATLERVAPWLDIGPLEREELLGRFRRTPQVPLRLRDNVAFERVAAIEARRPEFRLLLIETHPRRRYPAGRRMAHAIGYVGEIAEDELARAEFEGYEPGRIVGRQGIERQYESILAGTPGTRYVEVNARGSIVGEFGPRPTDLAEPGTDLQLSLDLELHEHVDSVFPPERRGAVVALDPRTGEVLLLYSHPGYDPNLFVGGIAPAEWAGLRDDPDQPLLNRATSALYPPGSTWKLVVSTLGMRVGTLRIDSRMPTSCRGALQYGTRAFRCWKREGHGSLDLSGAIKESCNVFFYQAGMQLGLDRLLEGAGELGFTRRTGLDLPEEVSGRLPGSREWYDRRFGPRGWTESVVLNLSIGQGENQQTVIGLAQFYAALALGRPPVVPHLRRAETLEDVRADWSLGLPEERRRDLVTALERVVNEPGGTAWFHRLSRWRLAGKTGTAQNPHGEPHSWFVGFAPVEDPRIVVAAVVEFGHPDNTTSLAVPLAAGVARRWLELEGVPPSPVPQRVAGSAGAIR